MASLACQVDANSDGVIDASELDAAVHAGTISDTTRRAAKTSVVLPQTPPMLPQASEHLMASPQKVQYYASALAISV